MTRRCGEVSMEGMLSLLKWSIWFCFFLCALALSLSIYIFGAFLAAAAFVSIIGIPVGVALLAGTWAIGSAPILLVMSMTPSSTKTLTSSARTRIVNA